MHAYKAVGWPVAGAVGVGVGTWVRSGPVLGWAWEGPAMGGFQDFNSKVARNETRDENENY
jgi:hypothetical protein